MSKEKINSKKKILFLILVIIIMISIIGLILYKYYKFTNTLSIVTCTLNSSFTEYDEKKVVTGSFKGNKLYKFDVDLDISLKDDYLSFKDLFISSIRENLKAEEYDFTLETTDTENGIKFKASYNEEQYKLIYGEEFYNSKHVFKESLEKEGYTCE